MKTIKAIWVFLKTFATSFVGLAVIIVVYWMLYYAFTFHPMSLTGKVYDPIMGLQIISGTTAAIMLLYIKAVIEDFRNSLSFYKSNK